METESRLVQMCIESACQSPESVDIWRRQRRILERIPSPLADALFRCLLHRRLLYPSLLEVFKLNVEVVDLRSEPTVDAEWMVYLGAFRYLRCLNLADCHRITSSALWALTGINTLKELDLSRCVKVNDAGINHILSISTLEKLLISETSVTAKGVALLSSLRNLSFLDLGGLPVSDLALRSLLVLTKLEYLDLWGSNISNKGAALLPLFPNLSILNQAWTRITRLPRIPSLQCLNLSNCTIEYVLEGDGDKTPLTKLVFAGTTFANEIEAFSYIELSSVSFLDVSNSSLREFNFLPYMDLLDYLDLSSTMMGDDSVGLIACVGANLRTLNLTKTRVTSNGIGMLAENLPKLESLSLSYAPIDDLAISYIGMMTSLKVIDLSNTNIKGFILHEGEETNLVPSLTALKSLNGLQGLNLEQTHIRDVALGAISTLNKLKCVSLRSGSLTDGTLQHFSCLSNLTNLGICDALLTNVGLDLFRPPLSLKLLDLRGCWLLTEDAMSSFCKKHPAIEIRHELLLSPLDQSQSPSRIPSRPSQQNQKQGKTTMPLHYIDQRLKYSREELLALQDRSSSTQRSGLVMPEMLQEKD